MAEVRTRKQSKTVRLSVKEREDKMIQDIIDSFDFQKCERVMRYIDWTWGLNGVNPTVPMLKESAIERLKDAISYAKDGKKSHASYSCSSGGLKATARVNMFGHITFIKLEFILTDWDSDGDY